MTRRPRRLRTTTAMRSLVAETNLHPQHLILPVFIAEGLTEPRPISAMSGVVQHTLYSLRQTAQQCAELGIGGIDLFGIPTRRDPIGSEAWNPDGILNKAIAAVREEVGDAVVICADTCLDEFTDHGHCGALDDEGRVLNDETNELYVKMAITQAAAGAHMVSPSGMMDHQVAAIRAGLDDAGFTDTAILAYSAKYASGFYGPFREAVDCQLQGDRRTYQMDPANRREAMIEALLDVAESADMVMTKPAGYYLDVLSDIKAAVDVPVAAYQVSGEYAMIEAASAKGWIDRDRIIAESVLSIRRAGADIVLTYWALELAQWIRQGRI